LSGFVAAEAAKAASAASTQQSARTFMGIWVEGRTEEANADQAKSDLKGAGENSKDAVKK
jgi:hypothetical protein